MAQVHLVFYLELFETSRFPANFQTPGWLGAAITAAGEPRTPHRFWLWGSRDPVAATARRRRGAARTEGRSAAPKRHSNATRIGRIYHGTRGIHSPPTVRPQPHTGEFQGWAVAVAAVDPSGAVATTACGVCWGKCGVLGLGVAFDL